MKSLAYAGDSPSKRIARGLFWSSHHQIVTPSNPAFVLASEFGGDIRTLSRLGVPSDAIIAVDRDERALALCRDKFNGLATFVLGDIGKVVSCSKLRPSVVFLDFCAQPCASMLNTVIEVASCAPTVMGVVVQAGTEMPGQWLDLGSVSRIAQRYVPESAPRNFRRVMARRLEEMIRTKRMPRGGERFLSRKFDSNGITFPGTRARGDRLEWSAWLAIREVDPAWYFSDMSVEPRMLSLLRRIGALQEASGIVLHERFGASVNLDFAIGYVGHRVPMALGSYSFAPRRSAWVEDDQSYWQILPARAGEDEIRKWVEFMMPNVSSAKLAALFDIDPKRVAAWRAVATTRSRQVSNQ